MGGSFVINYRNIDDPSLTDCNVQKHNDPFLTDCTESWRSLFDRLYRKTTIPLGLIEQKYDDSSLTDRIEWWRFLFDWLYRNEVDLSLTDDFTVGNDLSDKLHRKAMIAS